MVYLLQTPQSVAFCGTVDELYSALSNRPIASAMLHSSDNFEPLRHLVGISQHRFIECNADDKNPITQISLPSTVAETVCLQAPVVDDSVSLNLMPLIQTGEWAITTLNRDRYFEEREKRRAVSLPEEYQNFQLTRMAIGR